jgi:hypothetical protein
MKIKGSEELFSFAGGPVEQISINEGLTEIPEIILERAPRVKMLDLSNNHLLELPQWIAQLSELEIIFLSYNRFSCVPEILGRLPSLRMIGMRGNQIEVLPSTSLPASLEWLTLTDNHLGELPPEIGHVPRLRKLLLAGNRLQTLPESLQAAHSLELLRLAANSFESFPDWLCMLPSLAWLALAGNPCTPRGDSHASQEQAIPWSSLTLGKELGRGASGPTFLATMVDPSGISEEVAVKLFTSRISSDGNSLDEIQAAIGAGRHPNLVSTRAPLRDHPERLAGLVLDLVPLGYRNLAAPPNFQTCTRDVYSHTTPLSAASAASYAQDIAAAAHHLHSRGILHGDLYAHNILVSPDHALLSDFGAAGMYQDTPSLNSAMLERIEVRAYGILVEELLTQVSTDSHHYHAGSMPVLRELSKRCSSRAPLSRPNFAEVLEQLPKTGLLSPHEN